MRPAGAAPPRPPRPAGPRRTCVVSRADLEARDLGARTLQLHVEDAVHLRRERERDGAAVRGEVLGDFVAVDVDLVALVRGHREGDRVALLDADRLDAADGLLVRDP